MTTRELATWTTGYKGTKPKGNGESGKPSDLIDLGAGDFSCDGTSIATTINEEYQDFAVTVRCRLAGPSFKASCVLSGFAQAAEVQVTCRDRGLEFTPPLPRAP